MEDISRRGFLVKAGKKITGVVGLGVGAANTENALAQGGNKKIEGVGNNGDDYHIPVQGERLKKEQLNFSIFPENLTFKPGRNILIVSDKWQTACLYDSQGNKKYFDKEKTKPMQFMMSTGIDGKETPLGIYKVWVKEDENYTSKSYPEATRDREAGGAEMAWAIKLKKLAGITKKSMSYKDYDGISIHGRPSTVRGEVNNILSNSITVRPSHGCFGTDTESAQLLNEKVDIDGKRFLDFEDYVLNIYDEIPKVGSLFEVENFLKARKVQYFKDKRIKREKFKLPNDGWITVKP